MDGSPVRGEDKVGLTRLNQAKDTQTFQAELVRLIRADMTHTEVFFGLLDTDAKTLQLPAWVRSHLERHQGLALKLEQGAMVGISHTEENPVPRPASAARSSVVLIPVIDSSTLLGAIGLVSPLDGPHLSAEGIEAVRQMAHETAPILARLREIESLRRQTQEFARTEERAARAEGNFARVLEAKNHFDALLKIGWHVQSNIAHDLRTPLAAIRGYARMILDGRSGEINDTQREHLRIIIENTSRLIDVASWMNHVAELSAQHFHLNTFDLRQVWAESVRANQQSLADKSLKLTEQIPKESFEVIADREKVAYVFNELIAVAVKLSEKGSAITAKFSHGREREVAVKISANGSGIAPEALSKIFDRSFNSSVTPIMQNKHDAHINLSRVSDIVGMHGGRLFVNSPAGEGSTFLFTLPTVTVGGEDKSHEQTVNFGRR
ncbi:MAG TPA: HAMP domain-containing sensor histidine kinase [Terriglobia bacterium]|nr:HAMP domain-containing sensor histidine kinase [Terriglobia bacterium]